MKNKARYIFSKSYLRFYNLRGKIGLNLLKKYCCDHIFCFGYIAGSGSHGEKEGLFKISEKNNISEDNISFKFNYCPACGTKLKELTK